MSKYKMNIPDLNVENSYIFDKRSADERIANAVIAIANQHLDAIDTGQRYYQLLNRNIDIENEITRLQKLPNKRMTGEALLKKKRLTQREKQIEHLNQEKKHNLAQMDQLYQANEEVRDLLFCINRSVKLSKEIKVDFKASLSKLKSQLPKNQSLN